VHASATSQPPATALRHTVDAGSCTSAGQAALVPEHISARSHTPRWGRHSRDVDAKRSAGQVVLPPHISATSQAPAAARHTVSAGAAPTATQRGAPAHCHPPRSQELPVEHGASGTHAVEHPPRPSHEPPVQVVPVAA
jgi:hypothetical protein